MVECPSKACFVLSPFFSLLLLSGSYATSSFHSPHSSTMMDCLTIGPTATGPSDQGLKPQAKINFSSFKLIFFGILS
jgi:hypothetical protein